MSYVENLKKTVIFVMTLLLLLAGDTFASSEKHALLIGISDYKNSGLASLPGSRNDVEATRKVLIDTLEFNPANITDLIDKQATHTRIVAALKDLANRVKEGDFVYLHYSGHGSYVPDLNGDEASGMDQTWVSYGARSQGDQGSEDLDNYDILDDEIGQLLAPIYEKARQVVFVSDSCHSGTVSRGSNTPVQRAAPIDNRMHPLGTASYRKADFSKGVQIGSTEDAKPAYEIVEGQESYGLFTWYWLNSLKRASPTLTWHDLFKSTEAQIKAKASIRQQPQISGQSNVTVFGGNFTATTAAVVVSAVLGDKVTLNAGSLSDITAGSLFVKKGDAGEKNAVRIEVVETFKSSGNMTGTLQQADLLVLKEKFYPKPVLRVFVSGDRLDAHDDAAIDSLRLVAKGVPGVTLVSSQAESDLVLYFLRINKGQTGRTQTEQVSVNISRTLPRSVADGSPEVWVLQPDEALYGDGLKISLAGQDGISTLTENLKRIRNVKSVKALGGSNSDKSPVTLRVGLMHQDPDCVSVSGGDCEVIENLGHFRNAPAIDAASFDGSRITVGDVLTFEMHNGTSAPQYVYLLDIMSNGKIQTIYPTQEMTSEEHKLGKDETRKLGLNGALLADVEGTETIKVIVASRPIDVQLLEQNEYSRSSRGGTTPNALEQLLEINSVDGTQSRGQLIAQDGMSWNSSQFEFKVAADKATRSTRGGAKSRNQPFVRVRVFFGSNRNHLPKAKQPSERFGNGRGTLLLGSLWVSIPPNHEPGEIEAPSLLSLSGEDPEEHVVLQSVELMGEKAFVDTIMQASDRVRERRMLLYVHGYNNSFEDAAKRTAQIAYDLSVEGVSYVPLMFTWPSGDSINPTEYTRAWTNKEWAITDLVKFVELAVDRTGVPKVDVLAHSMGTNLFSSAALQLAYKQRSSTKRFAEVILAAPDIDSDTFYRLLLPGLHEVSSRTTVYTAKQDVALYASKMVHSGYERLGDSSTQVHVGSGADLVDVSNVNTSDMGHGYYAAIQRLLKDIGLTMRGVVADKRGLVSGLAIRQKKYWKIPD